MCMPFYAHVQYSNHKHTVCHSVQLILQSMKKKWSYKCAHFFTYMLLPCFAPNWIHLRESRVGPPSDFKLVGRSRVWTMFVGYTNLVTFIIKSVQRSRGIRFPRCVSICTHRRPDNFQWIDRQRACLVGLWLSNKQLSVVSCEKAAILESCCEPWNCLANWLSAASC